MALNINTNIGALGAAASASAANRTMESAMERLSTGLRINTAADDAAGMAISSRMEAQIRGLNMAIRNAADGQALIDTTEGAHNEVTNILQRMRELAVQSANDTNVSADRQNLQAEVAQLIAEIDRIADQSTWNGVKILDGSFTGKQLQIGADQGQVVSFDVDSVASSSIGAYTATIANVAGTAGYADEADALAEATIDDDMTLTGHLGTATVDWSESASASDIAALINAKTSDTGVTATAVTKVKLDTLGGAGTISFTINGEASGDIVVADTADLRAVRDAINTISGASGVTASMGSDNGTLLLTSLTGESIALGNFTNSNANETIEFYSLDADDAVVDTATLTGGGATDSGAARGYVTLTSAQAFSFVATTGTDVTDATASLSNVASVNITTSTGAASAITAIDGAINKINTARADLGAVSNRLDNTISNLTNITTNVASSQSRIQDADFAAESTNLAKAQILQQAATAMLAQANASKQGVLSLLQG